MAWLGKAWHGVAGLGSAWHGAARDSGAQAPESFSRYVIGIGAGINEHIRLRPNVSSSKDSPVVESVTF